MICWMNGEYIEQKDLKISPFDHGFLYGIGFFETFRTYNSEPIFLPQHFERLKAALESFRITFSYTTEQLREIIQTLNEKNGGTDGYFRLNVTAGEHEIGLAPTEYTNPNIILFRKELPTGSTQAKDGVILKTVRNTPESNVRYKSHHYGNNVLARFELPSLAAQEGIFLTADGYVAEGITSNIFWVKDNVLYTPTIDTGILAGITRQNVIRFAEQIGYPIKEGFYPLTHLQSASECFITTAIQHIVPIKQVNGHVLLGESGPITQSLQQHYEQYIQQQLGS